MKEQTGSIKVTVNRSKPFGFRDKIGYAFGDAGNNLTLNLVNSFLLIFYTNIFGLSGAMVGVLFLVARLIDAFVDVTVGRLTDNTKLTSVGRFKPWIKRMKYPLMLSAILLFVPIVKDWAMIFRLAYVFVTYLAFGIFYSSVNIPYGSMASAISDSPSDKTSLSTWRSVGAALGSAFVSYIVPMAIYVGSSQKISGSRFFVVVAFCSILGFLAYIVTYHLVTERVRTEKSVPIPLGTVMKDMFKNKALDVLVAIDMILVINQNLSGTTLTYLFDDYFNSSLGMSIALIFNFTSVILLAPFAHYFTDRFGRKETSEVALVFAAVIYGSLFIIHTHSVPVYLVFLFFGSIGSGMFNLMVWAFITDVIDNQQVLFGNREDGIVYGVNSFSRKLAQAIAGGFGGIMLTVIGYESSTTGGVTQSTGVLNRIYDLTTGIPTVCCALGAIIMFVLYPLGKKKVLENAAILHREDK